MKNDFLINEIISDYFMDTKPMCRVLDQRLATNFDLNASFDIDELREEYMEVMENRLDKRLFNIVRSKFYKFYNAYQGVWEFSKWLIEDEILMIDEDGISWDDELYQNYFEFRVEMDEVMFETILDIACEKISESELVTGGTSQKSAEMLDLLKQHKPVGEC